MKKIALIFCLFLISFSISAKTITHTASIGSSAYAIDNFNLFAMDSVIAASYKLSYYPKDTGFYFGLDTSLGVPIFMATYTDLFGLQTTNSPRDLLSSVKIPFGMRWPNKDKSMGFFIGGGPTLSLMTDFGNDSFSSIGVFTELGFETNKTSDIGFFISLQSGISAVYYDGYFLSNFVGRESSLNLGMSWRRKQE